MIWQPIKYTITAYVMVIQKKCYSFLSSLYSAAIASAPSLYSATIASAQSLAITVVFKIIQPPLRFPYDFSCKQVMQH